MELRQRETSLPVLPEGHPQSLKVLSILPTLLVRGDAQTGVPAPARFRLFLANTKQAVHRRTEILDLWLLGANLQVLLCDLRGANSTSICLCLSLAFLLRADGMFTKADVQDVAL